MTYFEKEMELLFGESEFLSADAVFSDRTLIGGSLTDEQVQQYSEMFAEPHDISDEETQADYGFTFFNWN